MERNVPRSQPVQAMKTTPFSPACQQSPGDHVSPKARGDLLTLAPRARSGSPLPSLLSWKQHQPRGLPRSHRLPSPHLTELSWCTPPPRAIPGRYPVPSTQFLSLPTSSPGSSHRARGPRPDSPPPGPPAPRAAASCAPPLARWGGGARARASAAAWPMGARLTLASPPRGRQSRRAVVVILWSGVWMPPRPRAGAARCGAAAGAAGVFREGGCEAAAKAAAACGRWLRERD